LSFTILLSFFPLFVLLGFDFRGRIYKFVIRCVVCTANHGLFLPCHLHESSLIKVISIFYDVK